MTAKRNLIKQLRQEIKDLEEQLENNRRGMRQREKWFGRVRSTYEHEMAMINSQTNNIANTLKYKFNKDLAWMALTSDPDSKFRNIKEAIDQLHYIAAPDEEDDANRSF